MRHLTMRLAAIAVIVLALSGCSSSAPQQAGASNDEDVAEMFVMRMDNRESRMETVRYNGDIYVPLTEIGRLFALHIRGEGNFIDLVPGGTGIPEAEGASGWPDKLGLEGRDPEEVQIHFAGIRSYLQPLLFEGRLFVSAAHFAEQFDRSVAVDLDGKVIGLGDKPELPIVAVNGEEVSEEEFNFFYIPLVKSLDTIAYTDANNRNIDMDLKRKEALDTVSERVILRQKVKQHRIGLEEVDYDRLNAKLDEIVTLNNGIASMRELASRYDSTFSQMVNVLKEDYLAAKLRDTLLCEVKASDKEIADYYENNKETMTEPRRVRVNQIMLTVPYGEDGGVDLAAKEARKTMMEELLGRIKAGEDFYELMKAYTEDTEYAKYPNGYLLDFSSDLGAKGQTAFDMQAGQISDVVETKYAFHILKLEEVLPEMRLSLEEGRDAIRSRLESAAKEQRWLELLHQWKVESDIRIH
ncbi:peptidylprolyl isomerase [Cohnella sp.]|uniref:peptidylprolyl isomerase n=1 Tax=Cohnella sp. TaxID=1883426 RepID=UPI003703ED01